MDTLMQTVLAKFEKERLDKVKEEITQDAVEKIKMEIQSGKLKYLPTHQASKCQIAQNNIIW